MILPWRRTEVGKCIDLCDWGRKTGRTTEENTACPREGSYLIDLGEDENGLIMTLWLCLDHFRLIDRRMHPESNR